ncbi:hypothetical protein GCM10028784_18870 [Myceligenerans cantabricum]
MSSETQRAAGVRPGKVIAVHLSYVSRAEQRGRRPEAPSYFLKPASSLASSGADVERPAGTELLAFEGEIALLIGTPARHVSAARAWDHVAGVTAANDLGVYDLRWADKGSNLRSKGRDGYTPLGPEIIDARDVDPAALRVRTWVNGELAQEDTTAPGRLLFPLPQLVADLSQHLTLEVGDVILTGTPAGSSVIGPGDVVEVEVDVVPGGAPGTAPAAPSSGRLVTTVVAGDVPFDDALGSGPRVDDTQRAEAWGSRTAAGLAPQGEAMSTAQESSPAVARRPAPADLPARIQHYIGGRLADSADGGTFDVLDPVTNQVYLTAASGKQADVDLAVAAARDAFTDGPWPRLVPRERARVLHRIADIVESRDERLAELESFDSGLPITQALGQARRAAENFRFFADLIVAQADDAYKVPGRQINYVNRKPIGVAGLITPWNTPFMLESWKLAPALATGNTVVLKPAEFTPLSASLWAGIFAGAGLPDGVFNLVNGLGEEAGDALVKHPDVPLISFTGESRTGQTIFANAAPHLKGLSMELGGKSPAVVFADADLDAAIDACVFGVFSLNGERCTAGSRILVERAVYDEFVERYAAQAGRVVVGDPADPATEVGALVHPEHYEKVMSYVELGRSEGRLVAGGGRPEGLPARLAAGNYVAPTVFADVPPDARIFTEEIFGPVVAITPFDTEDEALALANGVKYGLAAYVWTNDLKRAHNFSHGVEAGMVWLNSNNVRDLRTPFGGVKASGLGHEGGYRSIDFYTQQQAVHVALGTAHTPTFGKGA